MTPIYPSETPRRLHEAGFIGTYPGLTPAMPGYTVETIHAFVKAR